VLGPLVGLLGAAAARLRTLLDGRAAAVRGCRPCCVPRPSDLWAQASEGSGTAAPSAGSGAPAAAAAATGKGDDEAALRAVVDSGLRCLELVLCADELADGTAPTGCVARQAG
jgi:hypothetical protein